MYYYVKGKLTKTDISFVVVEAAGVGYKLVISRSTYNSLPQRTSLDDMPEVKLYTYMAIREDAVELFGFISEEELSAFKMLITVSGVGPKAAIAILSVLTPTQLAIAICTDDKKAISMANSVGPKLASRIILELKDKLKSQVSDSDIAGAEIDTADTGIQNDKRQDAQDALAVLGYSKAESAAALKSIDTQSMELDEIIKLALKKMMK